MSARIPHLLTHLLSSNELDALNVEMFAKAQAAHGIESVTWYAAIDLLYEHRSASFQRRSKQTPSARRKSLSLR